TEGPDYWIDGPGWVAYCRILKPPPPPPAWWSWLTSTLGISRAPASGVLVTARVVDLATGATRHELPHPVIHPIQMSPDGRLLAGRGENDALEVWDTAPPPRWPKAAALGAAVAGSVVGLGWWRKRARVKSTTG